MLADERPNGSRSELLRSLGKLSLEQGREMHQGSFRFFSLGVNSRDFDGRLSGMFVTGDPFAIRAGRFDEAKYLLAIYILLRE